MTTQEHLARAWVAAEACNLRAVLRSFVEAADAVGGCSVAEGDERALLIVWLDIAANILGHPSPDEVIEAYGRASWAAGEILGSREAVQV